MRKSKSSCSLWNFSPISFEFKPPVLLEKKKKKSALNMLSKRKQSLTRSLWLILYSWKSPENGSTRGVFPYLCRPLQNPLITINTQRLLWDNPKKLLGSPDKQWGGGGLSSAKSSTLVYGVGGGGGGVHHWHAANKESNLEFIVGGGGVLCYNIRAENMICCLGWEQVGGRGELTIFFLILVLSRCGVWDMSEKWQCVDLSCAGKQG